MEDFRMAIGACEKANVKTFSNTQSSFCKHRTGNGVSPIAVLKFSINLYGGLKKFCVQAAGGFTFEDTNAT